MSKELIDLLRYRAVATSELKDAEAFEKAVDEIERLHSSPDEYIGAYRDECSATLKEYFERIAALEAENAELKSGWKAQRELRDAVWNLMQMKGRHNTEIAYQRLEAIYLKAVAATPLSTRATSSAPETSRPSS